MTSSAPMDKEQRELQHNQEPTIMVTSPHEQTSAASKEAASPATGGNEALPSYRDPSGPSGSNLPSYARATTTLTPEERRASLQAFADSKLQANDNFGGHKGVAEGPPNDPFKVLKWAKRKMSGEKGQVWSKMSAEERAKWEADDGPIVHGDVDSSKVA